MKRQSLSEIVVSIREECVLNECYKCIYLHRTCVRVLVSERNERTCTRSFVANQQGSPIWRSESKMYIMTFGNTAAFPETC